METSRIVAVGRYVAVGMAWGVDVSCFLAGVGMSTKAMLDGVGVAGAAQLERTSAQMHRIRMK